MTLAPAAGASPLPAVSAASAPNAAATAAAPEGTVALTSGGLVVHAAEDFPRIVSYDLGGATFRGQDRALDTIRVNGTDRHIEVADLAVDGATATYTLTSPDLPGATLTATITATGTTAEFAITAIDDGEELVRTLSVPDHGLLTVTSEDAGATVRSAIVDVSRNRNGDTTTKVAADTPTNDAPVGSTYAVAHTDTVAAAIESNSLYDNSGDTGRMDRNRIMRRTTAGDDGQKRLSLWSGDWLYRTADSDETLELPWAKVSLTTDANDDGTVDWQDGGIAMRAIATKTPHAEDTRKNVITHIPFNIVSEATHPFLRTLDDVKRVSLATDGLGQAAMLKGYQSEGHDSAHPDYGGNYNTRAGGLKDLKTLAAASEKYNVDLGVHVNATEADPEAHAYNDRLMDKTKQGWNWVDQAYYINQRLDRHEGTLADRLSQLKEETGDALKFLYVDVYYEYGWLSDSLQKEIVKNDWRVSTEWASHMERTTTWSHWANDENYGGADNKGINSQLIRFVRNDEKDVWNPHPLLGTAHVVEFEGWTGQTDYNAFTDNVWSHNLPVKYLQQGKIVRWEDQRIDLDNGVRVTGTSSADRVITDGGREVLRGDTYLLPWSSDAQGPADKAYHYSAKGGTSTWELPADIDGAASYSVYELTDTGRKKVATATPSGGSITLTAKAETPYVVYPDAAPTQASPAWGEGTGLVDPGHNAGTLAAWSPTGGAKVARLANGHNVARLGTGVESSIAQRAKRLAPGSYEATVWAEIEPGKRRELTVRALPQKGTKTEKTISASTARNYVAASTFNGSYMQRVTVPFTVPAGSTGDVTLSATAKAGDAAVTLDDWRIVTAPAAPTKALVDEDFEGDQPGWGPFVKGGAGGITDARTHRSELHAPYTQKGWNDVPIDDVIEGDWSLKSNDENEGLVYRTVPQTATFKPGRRYEVSFDHQSAVAGAYQWVEGVDSTLSGEPSSREVTRTDLPRVTETTRHTQVVEGSTCGDTWVGLRRTGVSGNALFTLDNVTIKDVGAAQGVPECAEVTIDPATEKLFPGRENTVASSLEITESTAVTDASVTLTAPEGFTVTAKGATTAATLEPGASLDTEWIVTPPADTSADEVTLTSTGRYTRADGSTVELTEKRTVGIVPPPPSGTVFASDHPWLSATNGWGPVELDQSNGEVDSGDGQPLTLDGVRFEKGLGAHAPSEVVYYTGGSCNTFRAVVGIDDAQATRGTVQFSVKADGKTVATSPVQTATSANHELTADITGATEVTLVADTTADGNGNDHADWADATFVCE
ncbi:endo-alpha-N-acetylgalactosaminidase family protein [Janibacter sp. G1551]|uniref:endo-alpha-N-acetylgalactosaminidase family protein n=1 Tax=Janibacter sp. G1551 TaxID=3420440 RepID=UPI003D02A3CA